MATTATPGPPRPRLKRRRIIERPRLFALLDESNALVRTLVAPAGYGKTTLAEQWVGRSGRRAVWYTARSASTDVAALALGVARAAAELYPGCDERIREHLRAVPNPGARVDVLAELVGEELEGWKPDDWLVLDDYHELAASADAERFVGELVSLCPVQLLIGTRVRPAWATARSILYGDVFELNQTALAMDSHEAAELLADRSPEAASGLVALANGWPAVVGLASVSSAELASDVEVPESLYRFFAEEVFGALDPDVRGQLMTLSVLPLLDRELVAKLLGHRAGHVLATALDVGVLVERGPRLEIHPLARAFITEWAEQFGVTPNPAASDEALIHYRERREWDAAFELIARRRLVEALEPLLADALDDLLDTARLQTIESWCKRALDLGLDVPLLSIARAELSLRCGRHVEAQTFAEAAAYADSPHAFRALSLAGRAAHLASRDQQALELYVRAEGVATSDVDRRDVRWRQFSCAVDLERADAPERLLELTRDVHLSNPRDFVQAATYGLSYQVTMSSVDLCSADVAWRMIDAVHDPIMRSSFESTYGYVLALSARYADALEVATSLLTNAHRYRLDFAVPYALVPAALAHAGHRRWRDAERCLHRARDSAAAMGNLHAEQNANAALMRTLAQRGRYEAALALPIPEFGSTLPSMKAELLASRALALACANRFDEATMTLAEIEGLSRSGEHKVLSAAASALIALRTRAKDSVQAVEQLESVAFSVGIVDHLVVAYRSAPELLAVLMRSSTLSSRAAGLVHRVGDDDLARALGCPVGISNDPIERLTKREHEIYELVCSGLANRQIAELLVISEATVKLHVHHIYDKLGVRSRSAVLVQAALRRADQATSATSASDSTGTS